MRIATAILIATLTMPLTLAVQTGYCTGQYVEKGPDWQDGLVQEGDVFEYWCELPERVPGNTGLTIEVHYSNAQLVQQVLTPRTIFGTSVVIFP